VKPGEGLKANSPGNGLHPSTGLADERGVGLIETLVAVAIVATVLTIFLATLFTGSFGVGVVRERVTAENIARSQLELIQNAPYYTGLGGGSGGTATIQPDGAAGKDAYINEDKKDENQGNNKELQVKTENKKLKRSLLQFDLSGLPAGVAINSATLSLYVKEVKDGSVTINAHELTASWTEAGVTWNARDKAASLLWATPGGDYNSTVVASKYLAKDTKNVWADWDITSLVADWVSNSSPNYGLILESPVTSPKSEAKFKSSDDGTASQRPTLVVTYTVVFTPTTQPYPTVVPPQGYSVTVAASVITPSLQLVTATIFHNDRQILQVEDYKVNR